MDEKGDKGREARLKRIAPHLAILRSNQELKVTSKPQLLYLMQDLKDEGNTLFKEEKFKESWHFYCFALFAARQLERSFYHEVEKEFLATLFCNASLCCLKIDNFEEALKDADMALCCQPNNIKAMYRKTIALKGLNRYKEALDQANKGQQLDQKDSFAPLIDELKQLVKKTSKSKKPKGAAPEANAEWLEGTNATVNEKKKNMPPKNSKKKKAEPQPQVAKNQAPPSTSNSKIVVEDAEIDSDSTNDSDNDSEFASRWQNVRNEQRNKKATNNASGAAPYTSKPQIPVGGNFASDGFTAVPGKSKTSQTRRPSVSLQWPLDGYDFCLACRFCFVKEREGAGGCKYKENHPHSCSHDILIVRDKSRPTLDWLKIRPRILSSDNPHIYKYKMCHQFQNHLPCRTGEANCSFGHNHAEVSLWNLDRDRVFSIQGFINDAKKQGISCSEDLETFKPEAGDSQYIPGLNFQQSGFKRQPTPPLAAQSPPLQNVHFNNTPLKSPGPYDGRKTGLSDFSLPPSLSAGKPYHPDQSSQSNLSQQSHNLYNSGVFRQPSQPSLYTQFPPPNFYQAPTVIQPLTCAQVPSPIGTQPFSSLRSQIPPQIWTQNSSSINTQVPPPNHSQTQTPKNPVPSVFTQPPTSSAPTFSHQMPNLNKPPPTLTKIQNPFPQYKFQLFCSLCLEFTGRPWYYITNKNVSHSGCPQDILAFFVQDDARRNCWMKVRERATHRTFKGHYILCHSLSTGKIDLCKFKDNCSFSHNVIEQSMWKLEQQGQIDISEFIHQNKTNKIPPESLSTKHHVKSLMDKFGGYFRFICRDCFFAHHPMISSEGINNTCTGSNPHLWNKSKIVAHVKGTSYTPVDERKFIHTEAFYLMCNSLHFCTHWLNNKCKYAHSQVEKAVWMLERDTKITRDELVKHSVQLFQNVPPQSQPQAQPSTSSTAAAAAPKPPTTEDKSQTDGSNINLVEYCRTCWGKGQRSEEDGEKDKCRCGHSNFKLNSVFVVLPAGKEIRSLPGVLRPGMKPILCVNHPKCVRPICTHPHGQEELDIWMYMLKHQIKTLRDLCTHIKEIKKSKTRKINVGESVVSVWGQPQSKPANKIVAPGDLHKSELYCTYCGISCNSTRQWDEHCMTERHINNVNSDKEHQWNFRQPPWGQGNNMSLCVKHLHNQSCQYSHVPDMYNLCKYAHSQEELDEWIERFEWRQLKRMVAKERHMFSYTETLLEEYYSMDNSVNVISETLPGVQVVCNEEQIIYKNEKNAVFTWIFQIYSEKTIDKVALLHNKDRLHFSLLGSDDTRHQVASGDLFLTIDDHGNACYKVNVLFSGGMFGSFSQWVVFDFGDKPVLVRKLLVEIGDHLQHERVKELRENLSFDRWTSLNREIQRIKDDTLDDFTIQLLNKYKEPSASEEVVTLDSLTELNRHNYVHKMHKLLELEEFTRHCIIASFNLISNVIATETLIETGIVLRASEGGLFIKVKLSENLTEDTLSGKLVLYSVRTVLLAPVNSTSKQVYEATIVGENNYGYDGRAKEYIYIFVDAATAKALNISHGKQVQLEIQFQMDRKFFCRMHYALDSLVTNDVIFPDVVKYKPDFNQLNASSRIRSNVLNEDQMTAVRHIVTERNGYTPPFIMYGPFGTGKTETLAQATMALLKERQNARILICTQSNSAADLYITKHLDSFFVNKQGQKFKMLRLNAEERKFNSVPEDVRKYSYSPNKKQFEYPPKSYIEEHSVVVTTVENSMQLTKLGFHNFFTHIFIDEAGQALECEILMPLTLATDKTCVVLTGDHHQIGPTVYSQEARKQKFDTSILVRLYNYYEQIANCGISQVAEKSQQSPLNIFLSINYRTKQEILRLISSVFYGGPDNLKAYGQIPAVLGITPLMFYSVQGAEVQLEDSTSYLNHAEAQEVLERVKDLVDNWPKQWEEFNPNKLAVISFYSDQINIIRKMFRQDKQRPYLREVDIGSVHNFQGKEVRALFISTVRTSNLLNEPHIISSLEAGNDVGDLGFLSNPKLLNTALTRTQSFVGVVGDPIALCLIGECIQVWRTYVKHCSNMKSMLPHNLTYDHVRNQVINIQMGPSGRVVDMISKRSQDTFKQSLQGKSTKPQTVKRNQEPVMPAAGKAANNVSSKSSSGLDKLISGDEPFNYITPENINEHVFSGISSESKQRKSRQFGNDNLSLSSSISCEDIIFQLAKENQTPGEACETNPSKPEGITIIETAGFAVLMCNSKYGPYTVKTEDKDFVAFSVVDEDSKTTINYDNWSIETLHTKLDDEPELYIKCILHVKGDRAVASVIGNLPTQLEVLGNVGHEIEINGQLNRGHAFNGDTVVVQLQVSSADNRTLEGQVKGILKRALNPEDRLFVCTADPEHTGILTPINQDMPRIYCLTSDARIKLARKGHICVYNLKLASTNCIEFSHYEKIDPVDSTNHLFIVRYLTWEPGFVLPLGVVVGMLNMDDSLDKAMQVLEIEHNVKRALRPHALDESNRRFPQDFSFSAEMLQNRRNISHLFCFTISDLETEDIEMAISVSQVDTNYEVGIHVTDVVAFVEKDSILDLECEHRGGASLFPLGKEPKYMLPTNISKDLCSLKPNADRLAISVIFQVNEQGKVFRQPDVFRSIINSKQHFTHNEVEDILTNAEESQNDYMKSCIVVLYQLIYAWRNERLGNGSMFPDIDLDKQASLHSHLMLNEVKIRYNTVVAQFLLSQFEETTPLLVQPAPGREKLEEWKKNNAGHAYNSIPMTRAFLEDKVCRCERACTCIFSYLKKNHLKNADYVTMLKDRWLQVCDAVVGDYMDFELAQALISNPDNMPQIGLVNNKLKVIHQPEKYICSQDITEQERKHYKLCVPAYTNCTSPLRRYVCMVVQRLLVAFIEGSTSPYKSVEIEDVCAAATATEREVDKFNHNVFVMNLANALKTHPVTLNTLVEQVRKDSVVVSFEGISGLFQDKRTIQLSVLSPAKVRDSSQEQQGNSVQVLWEERIYEHAGQDAKSQYSSEINLDSDRFVCNISSLHWQCLLTAAREKDEAALATCVQEISKDIGGAMELLSKSYPEVLSDINRDGQIRHFVPFTFTFHEGQILHVQLSVQNVQGLLTPSVQLLSLTPCLDLCLEHKTDPSNCFASLSQVKQQTKTAYTDETKYVSEWLLPVLSLEATHRAVLEGDRLTIHSINISWRTDRNVLQGDVIEGNFILSEEFCSLNKFQPDLVSSLLDGRPLLNDDPTFSLDYLCVRYKLSPTASDLVLHESVSVLINNGQPLTWVGHCRVIAISKSAEGYRVKILLIKSSMKMPEELLSSHMSALCTIEWIRKTWNHRVIDIAVRGLQSASSFAKEIVTGKKPFNTIDPVPQDVSALKSHLSKEQQEFITASYRQPFLAILGGPGTGKSLLAASLAHLLVGRNRAADAFRQIKNDGYTTQLMVCAPNEKSLDVITEYLKTLNSSNISIVRVYSEEVEERDFPLSHTPMPSIATKVISESTVMKDVALHHLIRGNNNPESKTLQDQELMMKLYGKQIATAVEASIRKAQTYELKKAHIILCTCITSSRTILTQTVNIKQIIVDDAGFISESETIVPLVKHRGVNQLVLIGDLQMPQSQIISNLALQLGLARSLLHRYKERAQILTMQFRCPPTLISFPSNQFYDNKLSTSVHVCLQPPVSTIPWPGDAGFSSVFCHVSAQESISKNVHGKSSNEDDIVNNEECHIVETIIGALVSRHKVNAKSILVLAMTNAQANIIRDTLPSDVAVSTVLDSIGREAEYVILSTVRTVSASGLQLPPTSKWTREHLGRLADPHVVNLATTRAKSAFFIIGNKDLLSSCEPWKSLLTTYRKRYSVQIDAPDFLQSLLMAV